VRPSTAASLPLPLAPTKYSHLQITISEAWPGGGWLKATAVFANFLSHEFARALTLTSWIIVGEKVGRLLDVGHGMPV